MVSSPISLSHSFSLGAGKSLCYQLPSQILKGLTVVVCPLIALMSNQLSFLKGLGIRAECYDSKMAEAERKRVKDLIRTITPTESLIVYLTAEFLDQPQNQMLLKQVHSKGALALVAVDEAHCVIEWGTDFRKSYLNLGWLTSFADVATIALTASVTPKTEKLVLESLNMTQADVFRSSYNRPNIMYEVHYVDALEGLSQNSDLLNWINEDERKGKSGIVYCRSMKDCDEVGKFLSENGKKERKKREDLIDCSYLIFIYYYYFYAKDALQEFTMVKRVNLIKI